MLRSSKPPKLLSTRAPSLFDRGLILNALGRLIAFYKTKADANSPRGGMHHEANHHRDYIDECAELVIKTDSTLPADINTTA